ncbi:hypothetical protein T4D_15465 [Trichinella pseudospiralis]|uniref:Uncharacterized protein n=1 Tax=Trichinella pseudospiralis TaxID=6337 RepID=A0A0V1FLK0_TRIPS|nr:hypothetical protein T4D_15465 [Trichinella pseudospiralis]
MNAHASLKCSSLRVQGLSKCAVFIYGSSKKEVNVNGSDKIRIASSDKNFAMNIANCLGSVLFG